MQPDIWQNADFSLWWTKPNNMCVYVYMHMNIHICAYIQKYSHIKHQSRTIAILCSKCYSCSKISIGSSTYLVNVNSLVQNRVVHLSFDYGSKCFNKHADNVQYSLASGVLPVYWNLYQSLKSWVWVWSHSLLTKFPS